VSFGGTERGIKRGGKKKEIPLKIYKKRTRSEGEDQFMNVSEGRK